MHEHTDPASAAAELLKRRSIRNSLTAWAGQKGFEPAPARWSLTTGGEYYGVGAGVGISGFRANLGERSGKNGGIGTSMISPPG